MEYIDIIEFIGKLIKDIRKLEEENKELKDELETAIKGQEDFKKIINDLEAINRELLEELKNR